MKILVLYQYFLNKDEPGMSRFNEMVKYWEEEGHEITVIAGNVHYSSGTKDEKYKGKWITKEIYSEKTTVYKTYVSETYNKSFLGRLWGYFSFTVSSLTAILFRVKKHDVLIVSSPPLFVGITGIITKIFKRIPTIFEIRDLWPESAIDTGVLKSNFLIKSGYLVEKYSYKFADRINVLTPAFKRKLTAEKNVSADKIIFIPNGADLEIFKPLDNQDAIKGKLGLKGKYVISYFGAHGVANQLENLLEVAKICLDIPDIQFVLIGAGMKKNELIEKAEREGIANVSFVDSQPKDVINEYCNASDICTAMLQKVETFKTVYPNKVFDYMSCAKPMVIGIDGVARELVENSSSGYYADPENPSEFKEKILELYNNRTNAIKMGWNGYNFVKENFDRKILAKNYIKEIELLLNKK